MTEKISNAEFNEEEIELISMLREKGLEEPEARRLLAQWINKQEAWANKVNTSRANIEVNLGRAKLYSAAGFRSEAWKNPDSAREQAHNEGEEDLFQAAEAMMDDLERED